MAPDVSVSLVPDSVVSVAVNERGMHENMQKYTDDDDMSDADIVEERKREEAARAKDQKEDVRFNCELDQLIGDTVTEMEEGEPLKRTHKEATQHWKTGQMANAH